MTEAGSNEPRGQVAILRWLEIANRDALASEIDAIFFEASGTMTFASGADRDAFRTRWLGRYFEHFPQWAYLALGPDAHVAGYLVGSLDDPAKMSLFADIPYFKDFAALTAPYPAQLHVNLAPDWRGLGLGARLVEAFAADAARAGAPGIHVVTSRSNRNVGFYVGNGFHEAGALNSNNRDLVFLARRLAK